MVIDRQSNATINAGSNVLMNISGDDDLVLVGTESLIYAVGSALTVQIAGAASSITLGGDGQFAADANEDIALFETGGTLDVLADSRVDANASNSFATLANDDTFGIYGANDTVVANGAHDGLWIGQNGTAYSGVDIVEGLDQGTLFELQDSNVNASGSQIAATMNGDDVLTLTGSGVTVSASGLGNIVNIDGAPVSDDDVVSFTCGGIVNANGVQRLEVFGDDVILRAANVFSAELIGSADRAVLSGAYNNFTIGGNGEAGALDVVVAPDINTDPAIDVAPNSNVRIVGGGSHVVASGGDRVVVIGHLETISDTTGGNLFVVDGQGNGGEPNLFNVAELMSGDTVRMRADTQLNVNVSNATSPSAAVVAMGADDILSVGPDITVRVPLASGHDTLQFGPYDRVVLAASFSNAADLLAHTSDTPNGSIIRFDSSGDQLSLNVSASQVGAYVAEGVIKFG